MTKSQSERVLATLTYLKRRTDAVAAGFYCAFAPPPASAALGSGAGLSESELR
jgi:hypothetical protein